MSAPEVALLRGQEKGSSGVSVRRCDSNGGRPCLGRRVSPGPHRGIDVERGNVRQPRHLCARDLRHGRRRERQDSAHPATRTGTTRRSGRPTAPRSPSPASGTRAGRSTCMNADGSAPSPADGEQERRRRLPRLVARRHEDRLRERPRRRLRDLRDERRRQRADEPHPGVADEDHSPAWSPDGTKIAFSSEGDIYVMNADGSAQTRLTRDAQYDVFPDWSPDGSKIAVTGGSTATGFIDVINADGTGRTRLTHGGREYFPEWSPDGTKIAYTVRLDRHRRDLGDERRRQRPDESLPRPAQRRLRALLVARWDEDRLRAARLDRARAGNRAWPPARASPWASRRA